MSNLWMSRALGKIGQIVTRLLPGCVPEVPSIRPSENLHPNCLRVAALRSEIGNLLKDRKSLILGVWAAPGASASISLGRGPRPHLFEGFPGLPGYPRPP